VDLQHYSQYNKSSLKKKKLRPSGCNIDDFIEEIPSFDDSPELLIEVKEHYKEIIEIIDSLKEKQKRLLY